MNRARVGVHQAVSHIFKSCKMNLSDSAQVHFINKVIGIKFVVARIDKNIIHIK